MATIAELQAEVARLQAELLRARLLLKRAGGSINIRSGQRLRALRFQILNYLKGEQDGH